MSRERAEQTGAISESPQQRLVCLIRSEEHVHTARCFRIRRSRSRGRRSRKVLRFDHQKEPNRVFAKTPFREVPTFKREGKKEAFGEKESLDMGRGSERILRVVSSPQLFLTPLRDPMDRRAA